jgi:hypothetical protein
MLHKYKLFGNNVTENLPKNKKTFVICLLLSASRFLPMKNDKLQMKISIPIVVLTLTSILSLDLSLIKYLEAD